MFEVWLFSGYILFVLSQHIVPFPSGNSPFFFLWGNHPLSSMWLGCQSRDDHGLQLMESKDSSVLKRVEQHPCESYLMDPNPWSRAGCTWDELWNLGRDAEGQMAGELWPLVALPYRSSIWVLNWHPWFWAFTRLGCLICYCKHYPVSFLESPFLLRLARVYFYCLQPKKPEWYAVFICIPHRQENTVLVEIYWILTLKTAYRLSLHLSVLTNIRSTMNYCQPGK